MSFNVTKYKNMIDAILGASDPDQIKPRNIRNALSALYEEDLSEHQSEVAKFIVERFHAMGEERERLEEEKQRNLEREQEQKDRLMALELQQQDSRPARRARPKETKKRKVSKAGTNSGAGSGKGFHVELLLSPELQAVIGAERMSRPQVSKHLWAYIKSRNLQQESNKRNIVCDDKLKAMFHTNVIDMFQMTKMLNKHMYKPDEVVDSEKVRSEKIKSEKSERKIDKRDLVSDSEDSDDLEIQDEEPEGGNLKTEPNGFNSRRTESVDAEERLDAELKRELEDME